MGLRNRSLVTKVLEEPGNMQRIWEVVRDGTEMGFVATNHIRATLERNHYGLLAANFWEGEHWFEDDENFTNARFHLISITWSHRTPTGRVYMKAREQVQRMLAAGRANVIQVDRVAGEASADDYITVILNAHSRARRDRLREEIKSFQAMSSIDPSYVQQFERAKAALQEAADLRMKLFKTRWLPAQISAEEYQQVKDVQPSFLRSLYLDAWNRGYEAYREQVTG